MNAAYGRSPMQRKKRIAVAGLIVATVFGFSQNAAAARELNVLVPPGYGAPIDATIAKALKQRLNLSVQWQEAISTAVFAKLMTQRSAPEFDLACLSISDFLNGVSAKLWAPLDRSKLENASKSWEIAQAEPFGRFGLPITINASVLQYRTDIFKKNGWPAPTKWTDLADPKLKGRVGLTSLTSGVGMETLWAWSKNGGAKRGDVEPGIQFAKGLVTSGQAVAFPKRGSEANQLLMAGEIWITTQYSQSALQLEAQGAPVATVYPDDGAIVNMAVCAIVRGTGNEQTAHEFLNLALGEDAQRAFATSLWSSPIYKNLPGLPPDYQTKLILTEEQMKHTSVPDSTEFAEFKAQWFKRWLEEVEVAR